MNKELYKHIIKVKLLTKLQIIYPNCLDVYIEDNLLSIIDRDSNVYVWDKSNIRGISILAQLHNMSLGEIDELLNMLCKIDNTYIRE